MPSTPTQLYRSAAPTTNTTLYTNTAGTTTVVSTIIVCNNGGTARYATIGIAGVNILGGVNIDPYTTLVLDNVRQILTGTQTITGDAANTDIKFHISGTVIS